MIKIKYLIGLDNKKLTSQLMSDKKYKIKINNRFGRRKWKKLICLNMTHQNL